MGQHRAGSNQREWEAGGWGVRGYWRAGGSHRFWNDIRADIFPLFFIALWVSLVSHYSSLLRIFKSVSLCQRICFRSHVRPVSPEFLMCFLVLSSHRVLPPFSAFFLRCCLLYCCILYLWTYGAIIKAHFLCPTYLSHVCLWIITPFLLTITNQTFVKCSYLMIRTT